MNTLSLRLLSLLNC